jgi:phosphopantetheinyl transferase
MEIEVQVGSIDGALGEDVGILSAAEQRALPRLLRERDRRAFIAGRSIVRRSLGLQSGMAAVDVPLEIGPAGRPESPVGRRFSIAHAGDLVVVAFAPCEVGVDIEPVAAIEGLDLLLELYGSPSERAALGVLPRPARDRAFLTAWVRKEAALKASGLGITRGLAQVDTLRDVVEIDGRRWRILTRGLTDEAHVAALAFPEEVASDVTVAVRPAGLFERLPAAS